MGRIRWGALILVVMSALVGVACSGGGDDEGEAGGAGGQGPRGVQRESDGERSDDVPSGAAQRGMELPAIGPSVIKTADLRIDVPDEGFHDGFQGVIDIARRHGGFVLSSETTGDESRRGTLTIRVPAQTFETALRQLGELGDVGHSSVSGEDVSQEFIDLQARVRNLRAQETVLLRLMERAESIADTIRVQNELTEIQLEIERLRGRLRYLEDRTSLSTITVRITELGAAATEPSDAGTLQRAWQVARDTTGAIVSGLLIGGAALAPIAVVLLLVFLLVRWVRPRMGRAAGS